jgi:hypothetical protein
MGVERKCLNCETWNNGEDNCATCGKLLSPILLAKEVSKKRKPTWVRKETAFDRFILRWKNSPYLLLRLIYKILYTIGVIFFTIAGFFAYLAATPNG